MADPADGTRRTPRAEAAVAVEVREAVKVFGNGKAAFRALDGVSLGIRRNEFFTLLGPSGCGKTTLLRLIAGFEYPSEGAILLGGENIAGEPPHRRPVNTVFQNYALFPHMTVERNVAFGLRMLGRSKAETARRVDEVLELVRLGELRHRATSELSGGQQQRVALARALAPSPAVLLLDEPLSALDYKLRKEMQIELKRMQHETGITFVFVTHDQEEALTMSDRIAVMSAGRILQVGTPHDVYERPANRFVASFIGETNFLDGEIVAGTADAPAPARTRTMTVRASVPSRTGPRAPLPRGRGCDSMSAARSSPNAVRRRRGRGAAPSSCVRSRRAFDRRAACPRAARFGVWTMARCTAGSTPSSTRVPTRISTSPSPAASASWSGVRTAGEAVAVGRTSRPRAMTSR